MTPVVVNTYLDFVNTFGPPSVGLPGKDVWRGGDVTSPTYAQYAAQAWLKNSAPLTFVRLLGIQHPDPLSTGFQQPGWANTNTTPTTVLGTNGGAYGLFIIPSSSNYTALNGALAAVWYVNSGGIRLTGSKDIDNNSTISSNEGGAVFLRNVGPSYEFDCEIQDNTGARVLRTTFNFNPDSSKYIRKVFNTNPTLTNTSITPTANQVNYWLGETFESHLKNVVNETSGNTAGKVFGAVVALQNSVGDAGNFKGVAAQPARTGWVIAQQLSNATGSYDATQMPQLFRFFANRGDGSGDWEQRNIKISIQDIKPSPTPFYKYGTFTVLIRKVDDTDAKPNVLEIFTNCNLDPTSKNYVAARIGDKTITWDATEKRHVELGKFDNKSKFVGIEMNPTADQGGLNPELLPFGFFGPPRFTRITLQSGSAVTSTSMLAGSGSIPFTVNTSVGSVTFSPVALNVTATLLFPSLQMRISSSQGGTIRHRDVYFGPISNKPSSSRFDNDYVDIIRPKASGFNSYITDASTEYSFVFSLDDVVGITGSNEASFWLSGSRQNGRSLTASGSANVTGTTDGYKSVLNRGHDRFTMPLVGGFDGLDITERDPFRNTFLSQGGGSERGNYAVASIQRAIDMVSNPESLDMNLLAVPGITHNPLTDYMISTCETRGDAMAVIDVDGGYQPEAETSNTESLRLGSVDAVVNNIKARALNSSFAATYYPWVKIIDSETSLPVWVPPSVVALGTMAYSQEKTQVWFAPAGFNRGGLSQGNSGLTVVDVREKLVTKQRDKLYEVNINPIASFPSEGIVIFGQKTLQATPSALDRINVRRLVLFLKKEVSRIATTILFENNVERYMGKIFSPS